MTPIEARRKAEEETLSKGREEIAINWKKNLKNIVTLLYAEENIALPPDDDEAQYRRMADELTGPKRGFTVKKETGEDMFITLDDMDKRDDEKLNGRIKKSKGVRNFRELVPNNEKMGAIAGAIGDAVEEQTGTIGFLQGATVMNALTGLFKWIGSGFKGGFEGLKETIAQVSADAMQESVSRHLKTLRANRQDLEGVLTDEVIADTARSVRKKALETSGYDKTMGPPAPDTALRDARPEDLPDLDTQTMRAEIRQQILHPRDGLPLATVIGNTLIKEKQSGFLSNNFGWVAGTTENSLRETGNAMAPVIADSVARTVTSPNYKTTDGRKLSELSKDEYAAVIADEAGKAMLAHEAEFNLPWRHSFMDKNDEGKTYLDVFKDNLRPKVVENYSQLIIVTRSAENKAVEDATRTHKDAIADASQGARDAGTTGGHDSAYAQAQTVGQPQNAQTART